ncbi:MAG: hypothetical protein ABR579_07280 [Actinomycetota bacterium]
MPAYPEQLGESRTEFESRRSPSRHTAEALVVPTGSYSNFLDVLDDLPL